MRSCKWTARGSNSLHGRHAVAFQKACLLMAKLKRRYKVAAC